MSLGFFPPLPRRTDTTILLFRTEPVSPKWREGAGQTWRAGLEIALRSRPLCCACASARPAAMALAPSSQPRVVAATSPQEVRSPPPPPTPPALRRRRRRRQRCFCLSATSTAAFDPRPALLAGRGTVVVDARPCLREGEFPPGGGGGPSFSPQLPRPSEGRAPRPACEMADEPGAAGGPRSASLLSTPSAPAVPRPRDTSAWRGSRGPRGPGEEAAKQRARGVGGSMRKPRVQASPRESSLGLVEERGE